MFVEDEKKAFEWIRIKWNNGINGDLGITKYRGMWVLSSDTTINNECVALSDGNL